MNQLQQEELFVENPDVVESERIKVQQLVGKGQDCVSEVKEDSLRIPTTIMYGRKHYLLRGSWWAPLLNRETRQRLRTTIPNWPDWPKK